jgi:hypothetical protein
MKMKLLFGLASTCLLTGGIALASPLTTLTGATFGGTGIANNAVEVTTINGTDTITLGLTATPRFPNPPVGQALPNDTASATFFATPGNGLTPGRATWNLDYYISVNNNDFANYSFSLFLNGSALAISPVLAALSDETVTSGTFTNTSGNTTIAQDSENALFLGIDPNAIGTDVFELDVFNSTTGALVGKSDDITVDVGTVPDAASSVVLFGLGLASLFAFSYRQNRLAMAK